METGKTTKYFKYAIGEIVLVVIGILIALSINNWNENRKESIQEVKILKQLKTDLTTNLEELKGYNESGVFRKDAIDSIFIYFKEQRPSDDKLRLNFAAILGGNIFNIANTTYKNIESSSKQIMSNDSLRGAVTKMYEEDFKNILIRESFTNRIKYEQLQIYMNKHFKSHQIMSDGINYGIFSLVEPIDIVKLRANTEYENMLRSLHYYFSINFSIFEIF